MAESGGTNKRMMTIIKIKKGGMKIQKVEKVIVQKPFGTGEKRYGFPLNWLAKLIESLAL